MEGIGAAVVAPWVRSSSNISELEPRGSYLPPVTRASTNLMAKSISPLRVFP